MNVTVALVVIILRLWSLMEGKQTPLRSGSFFKAMECPSGLDQIMHTCIYSLAQRVKNPPAMQKILGSIPGLGRSPGEGKGYPFQYSFLENTMDCTVHGITKSQTQLSNFHFTIYSLFVLKYLKLQQLRWRTKAAERRYPQPEVRGGSGEELICV